MIRNKSNIFSVDRGINRKKERKTFATMRQIPNGCSESVLKTIDFAPDKERRDI